MWEKLTLHSGGTHSLVQVHAHTTLGFTHTLLKAYSNITPGLLTLYFMFTHALLWVYSCFTSGLLILCGVFTHFLLRMYSQHTPGLLTLWVYSYFILAFTQPLLWVYLHSTPGVLIFYFGFTHAILQAYSHLTSSLLALYSGFTHSLFWVASHFTPVCSYFSLGALNCTPCVPTPYSSFYWHLTPGSYLIYSGFTLTCLQFYSQFTHDFTCNLLRVLLTLYSRFTHTLHLVYSHFASGFAHTSHQVYTHFTLGLRLCWRWRGQLSLAECWLSDNEALERRQKLWINRGCFVPSHKISSLLIMKTCYGIWLLSSQCIVSGNVLNICVRI